MRPPGHKSQGLTKWTSLPFVSGRQDAQWLYVVLSRAKHLTRIYTVTGPKERAPELEEVPDNRRALDGYERLAAAMGRDRAEQLATDARPLVNLRGMPTRKLRAERDRLDAAMDQAPRDRHREAERAAKRHAEREQRVRELKDAGTGGPELARRSSWRTRRASRPGDFASISSSAPPGWRTTPTS